ncbi:MAG TPA: hypothetical protein VEX67_12125 [Solirubrobacteraceae bacterium]|nr:hypothetical protein [Solirubrobacteraceae bacterium]
MSLISEGPTERGRERNAPPPESGERPRFGARKPANTVRASQARAALLREARRDEQAVANWLRQLARPSR